MASTCTVAELLEAALAQGAEADRWVSARVIQDEYADLLPTR